MSTLADEISGILAQRKELGTRARNEIVSWEGRKTAVEGALVILKKAETANPDLNGLSRTLVEIAERIASIIDEYKKAQERFNRDSLCIGIGGVAGMGKSTFIQSVTGLTENQIPTGDKFCTTAVRSLIENSLTDNIAVVDFHSQESFLREVIAPMCDAINISQPISLDEFSDMNLSLPCDIAQTQWNEDILLRLQDAQKHLAEYKQFLTGARGVRVELNDLRPYVAYPDDGTTKAGRFLSVADVVVKVKFPSTDIAQLRIVDLPGIGEAGIDLAKKQTSGLKDSCDITLLVKKAAGRIEWSAADTTALDAMSAAVPLLDDQTKYTAILINGNVKTPDLTRSCIENARLKLKRPFEIIECDAKSGDSVKLVTMPKILDFLRRNLPVIDTAIAKRVRNDADAALNLVRKEIASVAEKVRRVAPAGIGDIDFSARLFDQVAQTLSAEERAVKSKTSGNDKEWNMEVERMHKAVLSWIDNGCGYGSQDSLLDEIRKEIVKTAGRPNRVVNQCRVKFRAEWEAMDLNLTGRIASLLASAMNALKGDLHSLVPERATDLTPILAVRNQIREFADRIDARVRDAGDDTALLELSAPLRRIAEFDLQFRFHLEPMLHATTHVLIPSELPDPSDESEAEVFRDALVKKLHDAADAYASGMLKTGSSNSAVLAKKRQLLSGAIKDPVVRKDVIAMLEQAMESAQSFNPGRIFAAVVESFADAFIRSKDSEKAFQILAREWRDELMPAPDEKTRLTNAAAGALTALRI